MSNDIVFSKNRELKENELEEKIKHLNINLVKNTKKINLGFKFEGQTYFFNFQKNSEEFDGYKNIYFLNGEKIIILDYNFFSTKEPHVDLRKSYAFFEHEFQCLVLDEKNELYILSFYFGICYQKGNSFEIYFICNDENYFFDNNKVYSENFEFEKLKIKDCFNITRCITKYKNKESLNLKEYGIIKMIENNICEDNQLLIFKYRDYFKTLLDK